MSTTLKAEDRKDLGSRPARKLRAAGRIPASIYGEGRPNHDIHLDLSEFLAARRAHQTLFELEIGGNMETALVREVQYDAFGEHVVHIEFRRVTRGKPIESEVDIVFQGQSRGGALQHLVSRVMVRAIPSKVPDELTVDAEIFDGTERTTLHAGEIELPEGVELVSDPEEIVAQVVAASSLEETVTGEEEEEELTEPELVPKKAPDTEE